MKAKHINRLKSLKIIICSIYIMGRIILYTDEQKAIIKQARNKKFYKQNRKKYNNKAKLNYYIKKVGIDEDKLNTFSNITEKLSYCKLHCKMERMLHPKPRKAYKKRTKKIATEEKNELPSPQLNSVNNV